MGSSSCGRAPLSEPTFLILLGLFEGPLHGWGLRCWVNEVTGGRVKLRGGSLFDTLHRLLKAGYLMPAEEPSAGRTRRPRRFYALTPAGEELVEAEIERVETLYSVCQVVARQALARNPQVA